MIAWPTLTQSPKKDSTHLMRALTPSKDSQVRKGGRIPGTAGISAFSLSGPSPSAIPVLIAVPHAGRAYSSDLLRGMRSPESAALKLEDRYADRLALSVGRATGACVLVANAPRAMIDLNRAPDDIDWDMFSSDDRPDVGSYTPSRRARSGLGLIPRRVPGIGELWKYRHRQEQLEARIAQVHEPYHEALSNGLLELRERWGAALLIDLHSMPPVRPRFGQTAPSFVVGDRFGASCHGSLVAAAFAFFNEAECPSAHNRPYAGGYVLDRHAAPDEGLHAIQIEIDRSAYLDSALTEPGQKFDGVVSLLSRLVEKLALEISLLGDKGGPSRWPEAAE